MIDVGFRCEAESDQVLVKYEGPSTTDCMTSVTLVENMNTAR